MSLTLKQIRRLALVHQGLVRSDQFGRGINAVERAIKQLHYVQIDTISVVERAHHHVLRSRVGNYSEPMLHRLLSERRSIFEYWSHAAAYLPVTDYRFYLPVMQGFAQHRDVDPKMKRLVLSRIKTDGPLQSRDFEDQRSNQSTGWWDWKPAKQVLEYLFLSGELMVTERRGFQKVYDLTERVLRSEVDTSFPTEEERGYFYVTRMLSALGIATPRDIAYSRATVSRFSKVDIQPAINAALQSMLEDNKVLQVNFRDEPYYVLRDSVEALPAKIGKHRLRVLSPFDSLVINRKRLNALFDFDYQLECYVPADKRRFGYFTLPLLLGDRFIGRMDCKIHRSEARLVINNLWLEDKTRVDEAQLTTIGEGLRDYSRSVGCQQIELLQTADSRLKSALITKLG